MTDEHIQCRRDIETLALERKNAEAEIVRLRRDLDSARDAGQSWYDQRQAFMDALVALVDAIDAQEHNHSVDVSLACAEARKILE